MKILLRYDTFEQFNSLYTNLYSYLNSDNSHRTGTASLTIYKNRETGLTTYFKVTKAGTVVGGVAS